jgi:maltose-binding protein MalE
MKLTALLIAAAVILVAVIAYLGGQAVEQSRGTSETTTSTTSSSTSSQYPIKEIYAIEKSVSAYCEITSVEEKTDYLEVIIELKYTSDSLISGDAFTQAEALTGAIALRTVEVLDQHGFQTDVFVWAYVRSGNGEAIILGNTRYDSSSGSYTFAKYQ